MLADYNFFFFFFFNDTATTEIYTLSLHDALPISALGINDGGQIVGSYGAPPAGGHGFLLSTGVFTTRSEEHTSELQSQSNLVCRLLLEKKNTGADIPCRLSVVNDLRRFCSLLRPI